MLVFNADKVEPSGSQRLGQTDFRCPHLFRSSKNVHLNMRGYDLAFLLALQFVNLIHCLFHLQSRENVKFLHWETGHTIPSDSFYMLHLRDLLQLYCKVQTSFIRKPSPESFLPREIILSRLFIEHFPTSPVFMGSFEIAFTRKEHYFNFSKSISPVRACCRTLSQQHREL